MFSGGSFILRSLLSKEAQNCNIFAAILNSTQEPGPRDFVHMASQDRAKMFQQWFFSETFTTVRWWVSYVRNVKK